MPVGPPLLEKPSVAVQTVPIRKITQFKDWNTNLGENWGGGIIHNKITYDKYLDQ